MNRRNFLKIAVTAGIAVATPVTLTKLLARTIPVVYGDGIHDDTAGLNAAINAEEFIAREECVTVRDGHCLLQPARYRITSSLVFRKSNTCFQMRQPGCSLIIGDDFKGDATLDFRPLAAGKVVNIAQAYPAYEQPQQWDFPAEAEVKSK